MLTWDVRAKGTIKSSGQRSSLSDRDATSTSSSVSDMQHVVCSARDQSFLTRHFPRSAHRITSRAGALTVFFGSGPDARHDPANDGDLRGRVRDHHHDIRDGSQKTEVALSKLTS